MKAASETVPVLAISLSPFTPRSAIGCPWCRRMLQTLRDESGVPSVVELLAFDLVPGGDEVDSKGRWNGMVYLIPHLCRPKLLAFGERPRRGGRS